MGLGPFPRFKRARLLPNGRFSLGGRFLNGSWVLNFLIPLAFFFLGLQGTIEKLPFSPPKKRNKGRRFPRVPKKSHPGPTFPPPNFLPIIENRFFRGKLYIAFLNPQGLISWVLVIFNLFFRILRRLKMP